eukprot:COSAG04_NODE_775_length_10405_cov_20.166214_2_plen_98_part_00
MLRTRSFTILLICVVLQTEKNGLPSTELLRKHGYGVCQIVATLAILPVTIYVIRKNLTDFREQAREHLDQLTDDKDTTVKNPLTEDDEDAEKFVHVS